MLREINCKIVSYCEIPEDIREQCSWLQEASCDVFLECRLSINSNDDDEVCSWIRSTYPELVNTIFMIHMDY